MSTWTDSSGMKGELAGWPSANAAALLEHGSKTVGLTSAGWKQLAATRAACAASAGRRGRPVGRTLYRLPPTS